jgi:uncharacterized protein (DUF58 family)
MRTADLLKKVRRIELKTRSLSDQVFAGDYHSAFKGRGMTFSEVREYQPGDDVRNIDWNVTARLNHPFIKVFQEERELTVMILVDVSASGNFGTRVQSKRDLQSELAAVLAFSAIQNNDKAGILFFSDRVEKYVPPQKGKSQIVRIIRDSLEIQPIGKKTDIGKALEYLNNVVRNRCIVFVISDFLSGEFESHLRVANRKHDVVALHVQDRREQELPDIGVVLMHDPETGQERWVDTSSTKVREEYRKQSTMHRLWVEDMMKKCGVDLAHIGTGDAYIKTLSGLFRRREKR